VVATAARHLPGERTCGCATALENAIITDRSRIPAQAREDLRVIIGRYLED
jgi:5'-methylthioadenosine phosphorylase